MTGTCKLTVLRAGEGRTATKQWTWNLTANTWLKRDYDAGKWFTAAEHHVGNLAELVAVLGQVQTDPRSFVVRGALLPETAAAIEAAPDHRIRRLKVAKPDAPAALKDVPLPWIMVDVDNWVLPPGADLADDPAAVIEAAIFELLPEAFQDAECWWHLSSSAGFVPGVLKAHLFFWLTEATSNATIKASMKEHAPGIDTAPFETVQPHYIANPIIKGRPDPIPRRTGWRKGIEQAVRLPAPTGRTLQGGAGGGAHSGVSASLEQMGRGFPGAAGFHAPIRAEIMRYARDCIRDPGQQNDEQIKAMLRAAIVSAPDDGTGGIERYLSDEHLDHSIAGAFVRASQQSKIAYVEPHHPAPTMSAEEASAEVGTSLVLAFKGVFDHWAEIKRLKEGKKQADEVSPPLPLPPQTGIIVGTGLGKTTNTVKTIADFIKRSKEAGQTYRGNYYVPTVELAEEVAGKLRTAEEIEEEIISEFRAAGRTAETWRGMGRPDLRFPPDADGNRPTMCQNLELAEAVRNAGGDMRKHACGEGGAGPGCPKKGICGWQAQRPVVAEADVVVMANTMKFGSVPREITDGVAFVVADEAFWQNGITTHTIPLSSLEEEVKLQGVQKTEQRPAPTPGTGMTTYKITDEMGQNDLRTMCQRVMAMASKMPAAGGWIEPLAALAEGLTEDRCNETVTLEWSRKREGEVYVGQSAEARRQGVERTAFNRTLFARAVFWRALADIIAGKPGCAGRVEIAERIDTTGKPYMAILVHRLKPIRQQILNTPTLLLDATMVPELIRLFFPRMEVAAEIQARLPEGVVVRQILTGTGITTLTPPRGKAGNTTDESELATRRNKVKEIADRCAVVSRGNGLMISYKAIEADLQRPGVATRHWNDFAGLDKYGKVKAITIVGRPLPRPEDMREMAIQLTGERVELEKPTQVTLGLRMANGKGYPVETRAYAHPTMAMLQTAITGAAVEQGIGRARAVWRTTATPCVIEIVGDTVTRLVVDEVLIGDTWKLTDEQKMAGAGCVLPPALAHRAYRGMWPTEDAAKKAFQRNPKWQGMLGGGGGGHLPKRRSILGECLSPLVKSGGVEAFVTFQMAGPGQRPVTVPVDLSLIPDPETWLKKLGALTVLRITPAIPALEAEAMAVPVSPIATCPPGAYDAWSAAYETMVADPDAVAEPIHEGLPPAALYGRGVLEPPPHTMLTLRSRHSRKLVLAEIEVPAMGPLFSISPLMPWGYGPPLLSRRPGFSVRDLPHMIPHRHPHEAADGMRT